MEISLGFLMMYFKFRVFASFFITMLSLGLLAFPAQSDTLPYGLKEGKPYVGTKLSYLAADGHDYDYHRKRILEFTEMTGIEVDFKSVPESQLKDNLARTDVYQFQDTITAHAFNNLLPLNAFISSREITLDRYYIAHSQGAGFEGKYYGLPIRGNAQILFYRKDILKAYSLPIPKNWKELLMFAKFLKYREGVGLASYYSNTSVDSAIPWFNLFWNLGGKIVDNGKIAFASDMGVEAMEYYIDLETLFSVNTKGGLERTQEDAARSFSSGESAFFIGWSEQLDKYLQKGEGTIDVDLIGHTHVPYFQGSEVISYAHSMQVGINKNTEHPRAAWEFLKWMTNPDLEKDLILQSERPSEVLGVHRANLRDNDINRISNHKHGRIADGLSFSKSFTLMKMQDEIKQLISDAIYDVLTNDTDPKAALRVAANKAQILLDGNVAHSERKVDKKYFANTIQ